MNKRSKKFNLIENVDKNWLFQLNLIIIDHFRSLFLIKSGHDLINFVSTIFGLQGFGSKMLIKNQFDHNLSQNLSLSQFNCLRLRYTNKLEWWRVWPAETKILPVSHGITMYCQLNHPATFMYCKVKIKTVINPVLNTK